MDFNNYFQDKNLKKAPNEGIHYEQKTTPDLLWCVASSIREITKNNPTLVFTDNDVRESQLFNTYMRDYFCKPTQENAENEYNKVSSYQLGLFAYAGLLEIVETGPKKFKVKEEEILNFISQNDLNASKFLGEYTLKFLKDNNLIEVFENYKNAPNLQNYEKIKDKYWNWAKENTAIRGEDRRHTYRVVNKIFNVYCYLNNIPGEVRSNIMPFECPYNFLIYNRDNFRDEDKPSRMTRNEFVKQHLKNIDSDGVMQASMKEVKDNLKEKYSNDSEIKKSELGYSPDRIVEAHHIFPINSYPEYSLAKENLILLTPDQHRSYAHSGNYRTVDRNYQLECLYVKLENIKKSDENDEQYYDLNIFIDMINSGYNANIPHSTNYNSIKEELDKIKDCSL